MSAQVENRVEELALLPWSRDVVADEDGVFIASIPELEGCFADGDSVEEALANLEDVLRDWLTLAVEEGSEIPAPRRQTYEDFSGRFSVRVPKSLHRKLSERAEKEAASLNQLVSVLLAHAVEGVQARSSRRNGLVDVHEDIAADAVRSTRESIAALKGIATFLRDRGDTNFAALFFAVAADRVATFEGAEAASRELGTAAAFARRNNRPKLAEALFRESVRRDPTNLRSSSALGQLLHHQGHYAEAARYLEPPSSIDNYALLFLGWSLIFEGREADDAATAQRGERSVVKALKDWSYQNRDPAQKEGWLRHTQRLSHLGSSGRECAKELVSFANANASWGRIDEAKLEVEAPDALVDSEAETNSR